MARQDSVPNLNDQGILRRNVIVIDMVKLTFTRSLENNLKRWFKKSDVFVDVWFASVDQDFSKTHNYGVSKPEPWLKVKNLLLPTSNKVSIRAL